MQDGRTEEGYVVASPRVIDKPLLMRTLSGIEAAAASENAMRAVELLSHIVPEYRRNGVETAAPAGATGPLGEQTSNDTL